jgi:hypothetical protein
VNTFCGHPVSSLGNSKLRLEYLTDIGPRIARLFVGDSPNLFAELPDLAQDTAYGRFEFMGGHRLWHAPEALPRTYIPDQAVSCENLVDGLRITAASEPDTGLAKSIEIRLAADAARVTLTHIIKNEGLSEVECAPWALSMFKLGGTIILPQPSGAQGLLPNRLIVLWPYTRVRDTRLQINDDFILLKADAALPPAKIGSYNTHGWAAYWLDGILAVKRFDVTAMAHYPDGGCNVETYCNDRFVELETLGALVKLAPGQSARHQETWEFYPGLDQPFIPVSLRSRQLA